MSKKSRHPQLAYEQAEHLLQKAVGNPAARFRDGQWEAIEMLVSHKRRLLVVERTGWGKSMVYFLATRMLRDRGYGPSLVISPLLALMRNQVAAAERIGLRADTINSANPDDWEAIERQVRSGRIDMLWISPERLSNQSFVQNVLRLVAEKIGLVVIDEAHCISDWGHDFRPDYRRIVNVLKQMPPNMPVLGTTATANDRVVDDIAQQLGDIHIQRGGLTRDSLELQAVVLPDQAFRLAWMAEHIPNLPGTGIVYVLTKRDADTVAGWLNRCGINARAYYSGVQAEDLSNSNDYRLHLEGLLLGNKIKILVATTALGMGYDKPDVGFVIHYQAPSSVVAYYQQVGRAGRAVDRASGVLLSGHEDSEIIEYFRVSAFPSEQVINQVLALLARHDGLSVNGIRDTLNVRYGQIKDVLKFLSVEHPSPVIKDGSKWHRTPVRFRFDKNRIQRLTEQREVEWQEIQAYIHTKQCRMAFLQRALNDPDVSECGRCDNCLGRPLISSSANPSLVVRAQQFLRRMDFPIAPRMQIPRGAWTKYGLSGNLPLALRASEGRALSRWGDAGWGIIVKEAKQSGRFGDDLVDATLEMIQRWRPTPFPKWITCIPSARRPNLVHSFAERLGQRLGLPFRSVLATAGTSDPQKAQQNSFHQCKNLDGVFAVRGRVPSAPVLLVDDTVDSRWTFTIAVALLREAGSGEVFPVALTSTTTSG